MGFLTDLKIRTTPSRAREYLLADGDGLYLRVRATSKSWLYRYKSGSKQLKVGLGAYPAVTLAMAREEARKANAQRAQGIDPRGYRRELEEQAELAKVNTFEPMAHARLKSASKDREWSAGYRKKVTRHLEIHVFPWVGDKMMTSIKPTEIVRCLHRIKDRGHLEMAQRVREAERTPCREKCSDTRRGFRRRNSWKTEQRPSRSDDPTHGGARRAPLAALWRGSHWGLKRVFSTYVSKALTKSPADKEVSRAMSVALSPPRRTWPDVRRGGLNSLKCDYIATADSAVL
jgi:hypothetical protein